MLKKYLEFDNFFILGLSILIPTAINLSANLFLSPILNSLMGRTENPELSISVYAISMSILFFIGLPHLRIQQLTIVYYKNFNKMTIHYFVFLPAIRVPRYLPLSMEANSRSKTLPNPAQIHR